MSIELKPCPFCGGKAVYRKKSGDYGYTPDIHLVECTRCDAEIRATSLDYKDLKDVVVDKWNRRVTE